MRRLLINGMAAALLLGSLWLLWNQRQISSVSDVVRLASSQIRHWSSTLATHSRSGRPTIRVASFNIQAFGAEKLQNPTVVNCLAEIIRSFDVVAVQEVRGADLSALTAFVNFVNSRGRRYAFVAGEPLKQNRFTERCVFVFDSESVSLDGSHSYTVDDPENLMARKPLVGWFRINAADRNQAFTFSLVNVHLDSRQPLREVSYLAQLFRAIRADGRGEDDIVIAGDFNTDPDHLQILHDGLGLECLITGTPTNVKYSQQFDNLLINPLATTEYTGKSGVGDFLKAFNLTIDQAMTISDHLPVWAEFSALEGSCENLTAALPASNIQ